MNTPLDESKQLEMLVQALQLVAAPYEQQIEVLPGFVHVPDEIVAIFDEVYGFVNALTQKNLLTDSQQTGLNQINTLLDEMNEKKELWSLNALERSLQWKNVRSLARNILLSFHETERLPNLFWIRYIKGEHSDHR